MVEWLNWVRQIELEWTNNSKDQAKKRNGQWFLFFDIDLSSLVENYERMIVLINVKIKFEVKCDYLESNLIFFRNTFYYLIFIIILL